MNARNATRVGAGDLARPRGAQRRGTSMRGDVDRTPPVPPDQPIDPVEEPPDAPSHPDSPDAPVREPEPEQPKRL
jgi:hypothetical protein